MSPARRLVLTLAGLASGAAGLWVACRLVWLHVDYLGPLRGTVEVDVRGADLAPALLGVAALAAAGMAATVATGGVARRVVGLLLAVAGAGAVWLSVRPWLASPERAELAALPGAPVGTEPGATSVTLAPALALAAASMMLLAGLAVLRGARDMPRLGARFDAPGAGAGKPTPVPVDRDRTWWDALDAGDDPTRTSPGPDPHPGR